MSKNKKFGMNKHDIISEDDDEYRNEYSHIRGNSQNLKKLVSRKSSPVSLF